MNILVKSNKTFRGPFTDNREPVSGESVVTITPAQYATLNALTRAVYLVFDGTTFRQPTNAESLLIPYPDALSAGYVIPGSSPEARLGLTDLDRAQFVALLTFLDEAGEVNPANETIIDINGMPHTYPVADLRDILIGYGTFYKSLVAARYGA